MLKHYVTYYYPIGFFGEHRIEEIESWDIASARARARPMGGHLATKFSFTTKYRRQDAMDSKEIDHSPLYDISE